MKYGSTLFIFVQQPQQYNNNRLKVIKYWAELSVRACILYCVEYAPLEWKYSQLSIFCERANNRPVSSVFVYIDSVHVCVILPSHDRLYQFVEKWRAILTWCLLVYTFFHQTPLFINKLTSNGRVYICFVTYAQYACGLVEADWISMWCEIHSNYIRFPPSHVSQNDRFVYI